MRILILNGSPSGENSITLQTMHYIQKFYPKQEYHELHVGQKIRMFETDFSKAREELEAADLIVFCYPVYTFLAPAQLHRFVELMKESGIDFHGKFATQVTTSKHFYDITAHEFIRENALDMGFRVIKGLSADMEDLLHPKGQKEALAFFRHVLWSVKQGHGEVRQGSNGIPIEGSRHAQEVLLVCEAAETKKDVGQDPARDPELEGTGEIQGAEEQRAEVEQNVSLENEKANRREDKKIVVVADITEGNEVLPAMIREFQEASPYPVSVVNLREFPFAGGCLGCFHCAADGRCIYKDQFDQFLREKIQTADACVYAFTIKDHSMGQRFKTFDDRQFCNGHRTVTMGKPVGYLIDGDYEKEPNLRTVIEARAQVGGNYLAGVVAWNCAMSTEKASEGDDMVRESELSDSVTRDMKALAEELAYCMRHHYNQPADFYGVGGMKIFRDLIYQMQGMMREDHRFYKEHGFYDFPQKRMGTILGMYLVGAMINNPKLRSKIGGNMTKGMLMPYKAVIDKAKPRKNK